MAQLFNEAQELVSNKDDRCKALSNKIALHCVELFNDKNSDLYNRIKNTSFHGDSATTVDITYRDSNYNQKVAKQYQKIYDTYTEALVYNNCGVGIINKYFILAKDKAFFNIQMRGSYFYNEPVRDVTMTIDWSTQKPTEKMKICELRDKIERLSLILY